VNLGGQIKTKSFHYGKRGFQGRVAVLANRKDCLVNEYIPLKPWCHWLEHQPQENEHLSCGQKMTRLIRKKHKKTHCENQNKV
jgi:hypothetical protein